MIPYQRKADSVPQLARGIVWCTVCGRKRQMDSAICLSSGWPKCCGYTMTVDSPHERQLRDLAGRFTRAIPKKDGG